MQSQTPFDGRVLVAGHHLEAAKLLEAAAREHRLAATAPNAASATIHALLAYGHRFEAVRHAELAEVGEDVGDEPSSGILRAFAG